MTRTTFGLICAKTAPPQSAKWHCLKKQFAEKKFSYARHMLRQTLTGSANVNGREPTSCLGRVFKFKLGCFCYKKHSHI